MPELPPEPPVVLRRPRSGRALIWSGCISIAIGMSCVYLIVPLMILAFQRVENLETPTPEDLYKGVSDALILLGIGAALGTGGVIALIIGLVRLVRRRSESR